MQQENKEHTKRHVLAFGIVLAIWIFLAIVFVVSQSTTSSKEPVAENRAKTLPQKAPEPTPTPIQTEAIAPVPVPAPAATITTASEPPLTLPTIHRPPSLEARATTNLNDVPPVANMYCEFPEFKLPEDFYIYAAGAYRGQDISIQIDNSGHRTSQMDIVVNQPDKPVVLMLGAYDPTIWNIRWTKQTRIVAVFASGYHRQVIAGLPAQVPQLISTYDNRGPCGYFYISKENLPKLNPLARQLFNGHPVDQAYLIPKGEQNIGEALPPNAELDTSTATPPESFRLKGTPLAGQSGLDEAVRNGILRPATEDDERAWQQSRQQAVDTPPFTSSRSDVEAVFKRHSYVILKPFVIPSGLYGLHPMAFYLPKGVPFPTGSLGPVALYDLNTGTCQGGPCGPAAFRARINVQSRTLP